MITHTIIDIQKVCTRNSPTTSTEMRTKQLSNSPYPQSKTVYKKEVALIVYQKEKIKQLKNLM